MAARTADGVKHTRLLLFALAGPITMARLDMTAVMIALPTIGDDLDASATDLRWVIASYVLAMLATIAVCGKLSDQFGHRRVFMVGVATFTLASIACGSVDNIYLLIAARSIQGVGNSLMQPGSTALVMNNFKAGKRGKAVAFLASVESVAMCAGPILGGLLTEFFSWRLIFWINVPVACLTLTLMLVARPRETRTPTRLDIGGTLLLIGCSFFFVFGIQESERFGWLSVVVVGSILAAALLAFAFRWQEKRVAVPVVNFKIFRVPQFTLLMYVLVCTQIVMVGLLFFVAISLQTEFGMSPLAAGLATAPVPLAFLVTANIGGRLYDRRGARLPIVISLVLQAGGLIITAVAMFTVNYPMLVVGMLLVGSGGGLNSASSNVDALGRLPAPDRGQGAGITATVRQFGATLGVAALAAVAALFGGGIAGVAGACLVTAILPIALFFFVIKQLRPLPSDHIPI